MFTTVVVNLVALSW